MLKRRKIPKNSVFKAEDFAPEYIELLQQDQEILEKMYTDWEGITDEDDSKFAKFNELLKHELFKNDRNPEQKVGCIF